MVDAITIVIVPIVKNTVRAVGDSLIKGKRRAKRKAPAATMVAE
jgi:hypothetical protein